MPATFQDFLALGLVALAAAFLVRRFARSVSPKARSGCASGCGTCSFAKQASPTAAAPPVVPLDALTRAGTPPRASR